MKSKTTVVFKLGGLGDLLMLGPSLEAFKKSFPNNKLVLITGTSNKTVLSGQPAINKTLLLDDKALFKGGLAGKLSQTFKLWWLLFSLRPAEVFILHRDYRYNLVALLALVPIRFGFSRDLKGAFLTHSLENDQKIHEIEKYRQLFALKTGFTSGEMKMRLYPTLEENNKVKQWLNEKGLEKGNAIALAVGGALNAKMTSENKRWSLENYANLVGKLLAKGHKLIFVGGPADKPMVEQIAQDIGKEYTALVYNVCGLFSVAETALLLGHCKLMISHDCGPMHIGSASGIPVIALFGPTNPAEYAPVQNPNSFVFWPGEVLQCSPCYFHGYFPPCSHVSCMKMITPDMVFEKVNQILEP